MFPIAVGSGVLPATEMLFTLRFYYKHWVQTYTIDYETEHLNCIKEIDYLARRRTKKIDENYWLWFPNMYFYKEQNNWSIYEHCSLYLYILLCSVHPIFLYSFLLSLAHFMSAVYLTLDSLLYILYSLHANCQLFT